MWSINSRSFNTVSINADATNRVLPSGTGGIGIAVRVVESERSPRELGFTTGDAIVANSSSRHLYEVTTSSMVSVDNNSTRVI